MTIAYTVEDGYVGLPITVDPNEILQNALSAISTTLPGWVPRESHIEVILLEQLAAMVSQSATVAAQVPLAIFSILGALFGINPIQGQAAQALTTWTMSDAAGYTIPAGTIVNYQVLGNQTYQFATVLPITVPAGSTVATGVVIQASDIGTAFNGIGTTTPLILNTSQSYVASIVPTTVTSGGVDPETTDAYLNRLSNQLHYITPRPILPGDFAALAANVDGVYRATAFNGLNPFGNIMDIPSSIFPTNVGTWTVASGPGTIALHAGTPNAMRVTGTGSGNVVLTSGYNTYSTSPYPPPYGYGVEPLENYVAMVQMNPSSASKSVQVTATCYDVAGNRIDFTLTPQSASGSSMVVTAAQAAKIQLGQNVTGTGITGVSVVTGISGTTISLSGSPSLSGSAVYTFEGAFSSSPTSVTDSTTIPTAFWRTFVTPGNTFTVVLSIEVYGITNTETHDITGVALMQIPNPSNLLPDPSFLEASTSTGIGTWSLNTNYSIVPFATNIMGIQATGTGSAVTWNAIGSRKYYTGQTYTIIAEVDATHVTAGTPTLTVVPDSGGPWTITWGSPIVAGTKALVVGTFTPGSGAMAYLEFSTAGCTIANGQTISFYEPQIVAGDVHLTPPTYTAGGTFQAPGEIYGQERTVTVAATDQYGQALSSTVTSALSAYLQSLREVNYIVNVIPPTYTPITVQWSGVAYSTDDPAAVLAAGNAAVAAYLDPLTWGQGAGSPPYWDPTQTSVWYLSIVALLGDTPGLQHLTSVQIGYSQSSGAPTLGTSDLALPGFAPMPAWVTPPSGYSGPTSTVSGNVVIAS